MPKILTFVKWVYYAGTWVLLALILGATCIGYFGRQNWKIDNFSHFRAFITLTLLLILPLGFKVKRRNVWYVIACIGLLINLFEIFPCCFKSNFVHVGSASGTSTTILHIAMLNVEAGNKDRQPIISWAKEIHSDVLVLHEIYAEWVDDIKALNDVYPYSMLGQGKDGQYTAILSTHPLSPGIQRKDNWKRCILSADLLWNNQHICIFAMHPLSPRNEQDWMERNSQLKGLAQEVSRVHGPMIIMSDLNTTRFSAFYSDFENSTQLRNASNGYGFCATWPAEKAESGLGIGIDHILISPEFEVLNFKVSARTTSDHLPLKAELLLH